MSKPSKFWMCQAVNAGDPRFQHATKALAEREAERLLREKSVQQVVILEAVLVVETVAPPVAWSDL